MKLNNSSKSLLSSHALFATDYKNSQYIYYLLHYFIFFNKLCLWCFGKIIIDKVARRKIHKTKLFVSISHTFSDTIRISYKCCNKYWEKISRSKSRYKGNVPATFMCFNIRCKFYSAFSLNEVVSRAGREPRTIQRTRGTTPVEEAKGKTETERRQESTTSVAAGCTCITCRTDPAFALPRRIVQRSSDLRRKKKRRRKAVCPSAESGMEHRTNERAARCSVKFSNLQISRNSFSLFGIIRERGATVRERGFLAMLRLFVSRANVRYRATRISA